jgi:hypothetical protein
MSHEARPLTVVLADGMVRTMNSLQRFSGLFFSSAPTTGRGCGGVCV